MFGYRPGTTLGSQVSLFAVHPAPSPSGTVETVETDRRVFRYSIVLFSWRGPVLAVFLHTPLLLLTELSDPLYHTFDSRE